MPHSSTPNHLEAQIRAELEANRAERAMIGGRILRLLDGGHDASFAQARADRLDIEISTGEQMLAMAA